MEKPLTPFRTATIEIREALEARGYRLIASHPGMPDSEVLAWMVCQGTRPGNSPLLVLQTFRDTGCELFQPLCSQNDIAATIAALP